MAHIQTFSVYERVKKSNFGSKLSPKQLVTCDFHLLVTLKMRHHILYTHGPVLTRSELERTRMPLHRTWTSYLNSLSLSLSLFLALFSSHIQLSCYCNIHLTLMSFLPKVSVSPLFFNLLLIS